MKVILTEEQLRQVIQEEVIEEGFISSLLAFDDPNKIVKQIVIALLVGTITFASVPKIVNRVSQENPAIENVDKQSFIDKIKNVWQNIMDKDARITNRMKADAEKFAKPATEVSDTALSRICQWETQRDFGYQMGPKDLNGYVVKGETRKTYGYGLRVHPNGKYMQDVKKSWTQPELEELFKQKIEIEKQWVLDWAKKNGIELKQGQLDAMVSAVYNYGRAGFLRTGIPAMIAENPDNPEIPEVWAHASDHRKKMGGLHARRREEAKWYQNDMNAIS